MNFMHVVDHNHGSLMRLVRRALTAVLGPLLVINRFFLNLVFVLKGSTMRFVAAIKELSRWLPLPLSMSERCGPGALISATSWRRKRVRKEQTIVTHWQSQIVPRRRLMYCIAELTNMAKSKGVQAKVADKMHKTGFVDVLSKDNKKHARLAVPQEDKCTNVNEYID